MKNSMRQELTRRQALFFAVSGAAVWTVLYPARAVLAARPEILVYKSPECGCCGLWSTHLTESGFAVRIVEIDDLTPVKRQARVPEDLETCHTAFLDGYVVEGHVPVGAIDKLLNERPSVIGVAVPGMPAGAPGMPGAQREPFDVLTFAADGRRTLFMSFR
ncbi:MAG TPA: DUF411 domain-containing protein [Dongiaceae bacterium]|nr:DUF411 domain-containing protein [Dongiaceae bacterium]